MMFVHPIRQEQAEVLMQKLIAEGKPRQPWKGLPFYAILDYAGEFLSLLPWISVLQGGKWMQLFGVTAKEYPVLFC